jgi:adenosylcobinamide amidohydrolase
MDDTRLERAGRFLVARFAAPHRMLSFAIVRGGFAVAREVAWCGVRDDELVPPVDPRRFLERELSRAGLGAAVGLMTGAALDGYVDVSRSAGDVAVRTVATVGLDNALRAGDPVVDDPPAVGTINVLCRASLPVSDEGLIEMLSMVAEARALAVLEGRVASRCTGRPATGTGTDCTVVAAPCGTPVTGYAGKHTVLGHLVGATVAEAVGRGVRSWLAAHGARVAARGGA